MIWKLRGDSRPQQPALPADDEEPLLNPDEESPRSSQEELATKPTRKSQEKSTWVRTTIITVLLAAVTVCSLGAVICLVGSHTFFAPRRPAQREHHPMEDFPIKNIVVLVQENLAFDTIAGGLTYNPDIDGLVNRTFCNPADVSNANTSPLVCANPIAKNVATDDPDHSITGGNQQVYGTDHPDPEMHRPNMQGFVTEQIRAHGLGSDLMRAAEVINYYPPEHVPVFNALAENYLLFDRWFAAVPGPTNPNRAYLTSGTSRGHGHNDRGFDVSALPQLSIFEQLSAANISWINYSNTTGFAPDAMFYQWTVRSGHSRTSIKPIDRFYQDARAGTLPRFTWINPECCSYMSFHPPSPINMGEGFVKSIYEAVRSSPQWNETLFILTFDEHGGFADHVPPPENVPPGDSYAYTEVARDGKSATFHFDRLGIRVPTILISPWVERGVVEHAPTTQRGEYTHTSILKFVAELWDLDILTPRVAWSPSFAGLITRSYRDDTPELLPAPADF
ncbi:hypothetical protein AOCH_001323 [Aspergillus ochraceoroseus]|uniref:Phosphatidylglycerol specific phospholipase n=1 Tax=Aspergillus ochraceoroseus TaxID=138278 RepID=A0A0F8X757_9EURO|nr:hypothetical protein AOCH_001323 [Aspergillus ochraceoroseus]